VNIFCGEDKPPYDRLIEAIVLDHSRGFRGYVAVCCVNRHEYGVLSRQTAVRQLTRRAWNRCHTLSTRRERDIQ